jgi:hypothetical protein
MPVYRLKSARVDASSALLALPLLLLSGSVCPVKSQTEERQRAGQHLRMQVTDSENGEPIAQAHICVVFWREQDGAMRKEEIDLKTDAAGTAELATLRGERSAVRVEAKGYVSYSRWLRPTPTGKTVQIHLEKWRRHAK